MGNSFNDILYKALHANEYEWICPVCGGTKREPLKITVQHDLIHKKECDLSGIISFCSECKTFFALPATED